MKCSDAAGSDGSTSASTLGSTQSVFCGSGDTTTNPRHPSSEKFHALLKEIGELHDMKQADYGSVTDPFANVRAADEWGVPAWVGGMIRATDKVRRLQSYARTGTLRNEGVRDSFLDLAVYSLISFLLWEEETPQDVA